MPITSGSFRSYSRTDKINGVIKHRDPARTVIRVSDGKIISGSEDSIDVDTGKYHSKSNPVSHPAFDPTCYRATGETPTNYNGAPAIKFDLAPTCKSASPDDDEYPFTTLYASADAFAPLDVDQAYGNYEGHVLPSFWLQIHVTETYSEYAFSDKP